MGSLKDLLSNESIEKLVVSTVDEGDVFRMRLGEEEQVKGKNPEDEGRNKYFVVIGHDAEGNAIGFVLIDSEINRYLPERRKLLHYPLEASAYDFLKGKSRFVDCSDFKIISQKKFTQMFGIDKAKGKLSAEDLKFIKNAIVSYENAVPKVLKRFGLI